VQFDPRRGIARGSWESERRAEMKLRTLLIVVGASVVAGLSLGRPTLTAGEPQSPQPTLTGFTGQYVLIEKKDGGVVVLQRPELRTVGERPYLVGRTVPLPGITDDGLFVPTAQWVYMEDIRRMGETDSASTLLEIREMAQRRRAIQSEP